MSRVLPALVLLFLTACTARIQHGLDEADANELQSLLLEKGFDARKVPEAGKKPTWAIELPEEQATGATRLLSEHGLPRPKTKGFKGIEPGMVPTPTQERAAYVNALSEELQSTLVSVAGVTSARVHLVIPAPARPGQPAGQPRASALLRVRQGYGSKVRGLEEDLRRLVAGSVEGLRPEDVTLVVNEISSSVAAPPAGASPTARLRYLVIGLGALVSVLALGLVFIALRLRRATAQSRESSSATEAPAPTPPARPVVNAAASSRKAA